MKINKLRLSNMHSALFKLIGIFFFLLFLNTSLVAQDFITGYGASAWNMTGKTVVHVTNLNDSGPGSLRDAVSSTDRIVLFDVGGIIELSSTLTVSSNTVVAAFTAPGDYGIICKSAGIKVSGNNVAIVGMKVWMDDFSSDTDAIQVNRSSNVLIAYGSYLFGSDECLSTYAGGTTSEIVMDDVTFFGNLAVGANNNHHAAGGMMNGKGVNNVDFIQCVAAFNQIRNFRFAGSVTGQQQRGNQYNCVAYNWLNQANESSGDPDVNVIGNYFKRGPRNGSKEGIHNEGGRIYMADNNDDANTGGSGWTEMSTPHSTPYTYTFLTADAAYDKLVTNRGVGWKNTPLEEAILSHIENGTMPAAAGSNDGIEDISQLGGWPTIPQTSTTHTYTDIETYLLSFFDGTPPPPPGNANPFINAIGSYPVDVNEVLGPINFTIGDVETPASQLAVTGISSDQSLVKNENIVLGGSGTTRTFTITPEPDAIGTTSITLTVSDGEDVGTESFGVTISVNEPPTITAIADQTIQQNQTLGPITFVIADDKDPAADLRVSASSTNQSLVEDREIILGGSDANRNITLTPKTNVLGTSTITVVVSDGHNDVPESFLLTVVEAPNQAPTITEFANQTINQGETLGPINFTVRDTESPAGDLTLTGSSDNQSLVADSDITFGGSGASRNVTIVPDPNSSGSTIITLTVSDGEISTDMVFRLTVLAPPTVNTPPTITSIANQAIDQGASLGPIPFTIGDAESAISALTVIATSSNQTLVRDNQITIVGTGATRDLNISPTTTEFGTATITLTVSDGTVSTVETFLLTVIETGGDVIITFSVTVQDASCGSSDGSIDLSVSGGTAPYSYSWSTGATTANISNLSAGTYSITVVDANNLSRSASFLVSSPGPDKPSIEQSGNDLTASSASAYQWYLNGELIDGATEAALTATQSGNYSVAIFDETGCSTISDELAVEIEVAPDSDLIGLEIYPNPASSTVNIDLSMNTSLNRVDVRIYTIQGRPVFKKSFGVISAQQLKESIDIQNLRRGMYLIKIKVNQEMVVRRLIVSS